MLTRMYYIVLWCFVLQHIIIHFEIAQVKYGSGSMVQRLPLGMAAGMALMVKPALLHCASATEIASAATSSSGQVVQAADLASGLPGGVEPQTVVSPEWLNSMLSNDKLKVPPFSVTFLRMSCLAFLFCVCIPHLAWVYPSALAH